MKIAIFINTPAQAHLYKNTIRGLTDGGHTVYALARDYGETMDLLGELKIEHFLYSAPPVSKLGKILSFPRDILKARSYLKNKDVDLITGFGVYSSYAALLLRVPDIIFNDSEPLISGLYYSLQLESSKLITKAFLTPSSFRQDLGKKQVRVESYKELAYLYPGYYRPNDDIYGLLGIPESQEYCLLRFNAFDAVHDNGIRGFTPEDKIRLAGELSKHVRVFISSEAGVPEQIKDHVLKIPKNRIHDAIYHAKLLVTDTQTMATEAAILGTPTVRCNTFVGDNDMGNFIELESKYGLLCNYKDSEPAIEKAVELAKGQGVKEAWRAKSDTMLADKIDINKFMIWLLGNYPESLKQIQANPGIQHQFRQGK